jgi:hypothetical protein
MADEALSAEQMMEMRKKRTFKKFTFRGVDLDKLLDLGNEVCAMAKAALLSVLLRTS